MQELENCYTKVILVCHGTPLLQQLFTSPEKQVDVLFDKKTLLSPEGIHQMFTLATRIPPLEWIYTNATTTEKDSAFYLMTAQNANRISRFRIITVPQLAAVNHDSGIGAVVKELLKPCFHNQKNVETSIELQLRIIPTVKAIIQANRGKNIGIVCQPTVIRLIALLLIEKYEGNLPDNLEKINQYNYVNYGEAWELGFDTSELLVHAQMICREDNRYPGKCQFEQYKNEG